VRTGEYRRVPASTGEYLSLEREEQRPCERHAHLVLRQYSRTPTLRPPRGCPYSLNAAQHHAANHIIPAVGRRLSDRGPFSRTHSRRQREGDGPFVRRTAIIRSPPLLPVFVPAPRRGRQTLSPCARCTRTPPAQPAGTARCAHVLRSAVRYCGVLWGTLGYLLHGLTVWYLAMLRLCMVLCHTGTSTLAGSLTCVTRAASSSVPYITADTSETGPATQTRK
jgi:hypothetical protein